MSAPASVNVDAGEAMQDGEVARGSSGHRRESSDVVPRIEPEILSSKNALSHGPIIRSENGGQNSRIGPMLVSSEKEIKSWS